MTEFTFGPYRLSVDPARTREYYASHPLPWVTCECSGCRNFVRAVKTLPPAVTEVFAALGLDPEKPAETMYYTGTAERVCGGGWYHLCGTLGEDAPAGPMTLVELTEDFSIAFRTDCALLPKDFPRPCVQMEVEFRLPWLLEEENDYISP